MLNEKSFNNLTLEDRKEILKDDELLRLYCSELSAKSQSENPNKTAREYYAYIKQIKSEPFPGCDFAIIDSKHT